MFAETIATTQHNILKMIQINPWNINVPRLNKPILKCKLHSATPPVPSPTSPAVSSYSISSKPYSIRSKALLRQRCHRRLEHQPGRLNAGARRSSGAGKPHGCGGFSHSLTGCQRGSRFFRFLLQLLAKGRILLKNHYHRY